MQQKTLHRRNRNCFLIILLLFAAGVTRIYAYDFSAVCETGQTLYYNIIDAENHYVELTCPGEANWNNCWSDFIRPTGNIILPENVQYNGTSYIVTTIGNYAFCECYELTGNLTIPNTVTSIGNHAFSGCSGFTGSLTIGNSVTTIGYSAFYGCSGFTGSLTIPNSVTLIDSEAFSDCSGFTGSLTIGNSVTSIGNDAFYGCSGFTGSLTIGNSVTTIGDYAFYGCSGFTSVSNLAETPPTVGSSAFNNVNPSIPLTVPCGTLGAYLSASGWDYFNNIQEDCGNDDPLTYSINDDGVSVTVTGHVDGTNATGELIIPATKTIDGVTYTVTAIGQSAFNGCTSLTGSLTIPNSVTTIGDGAFLQCGGLTSLELPNSVTTIGDGAFNNCVGFTGSLTIPNSVTSIGDYTFYYCHGFTGSLTIGSSVTSIGENAFRGCNGFSGSLTLPNSVTTIGDYAFYSCSGFTDSLTLPNSVTTIGEQAFYGCDGFTGSLTIPNSVTLIGEYAFNYCVGLTSLTIPNSLVSMGTNPFAGCPGLVHIEVASGNTVYDSRGNCNAIIETNTNTLITGCMNSTIQNSVTTIGSWAFYGCIGLASVEIPNSVTTIGEHAFNYCEGLTSIQTLAVTPPTVGFSAFNNVNQSIPLTVPCGTLGAYQSASGWDYFNNIQEDCGNDDPLIYSINDDGVSVTVTGHVDGTNATGELIIPATKTIDGVTYTVTTIGEFAFFNCSGFVGSLTIPNTVTTIADGAFGYCSGFTGSLTMGNSVTTIGDGAFEYCSGFTGSLTIPNSVTTIAYCAFINCGGFTGDLIIPNSVTTIRGFAFMNCIGFTGDLTIPNSVTVIDSAAFCQCRGFTGDLTIPNSVTTIGGLAFANCNNFTGSLTIGNSVTSVGDRAFYGCWGFTDVYYTGDIEQWCNISFWGNYSNPLRYAHNLYVNNALVTNLVIPNNVTEIKDYAFFGATCLTSLTIGNSVISIGNYAFYSGNGLSELTVLRIIPPSIGTNAFYFSIFNIPVTVPCGTIEAYQNALGWDQFTNYQEDCSTTISDEICYGEDYLQNGFEIYYPEVGENQYSITLPSSQGIDSIVNLTLTVYPVYFFAEDTTLCNASSYEWRGNTYTESGIYYDSLQTIHGCDSIFQLSLELFNTPLGEFTYMTPTNNYPFTSLPITFSWDAVSGAEYYNLYLWNANDPVPEMPVMSHIYNRSCVVTSLQNHQTYQWYVEAVNTCFTTESSVRNFTLNIPPMMNASTGSLDFGEVALNNSHTLGLYVSGNALDDSITLQMTGEDASQFSFAQGSNWNELLGGSLSVTFSPTTIQYSYNADLVITSGTLSQTVHLSGSLAGMFVFNTYVTQDVFEMNSTIPIYGTVTDVNNNPMASAEVEVKVMVMGTTRSLFATTGDDGHFSVDFVPTYSESGYYTINSGRVSHNSTAVHDDFNIPGMNLVSNGWILWNVVQNETTTGSIVIRNRSQIPLTNIQVTATNLPEGCAFTFQPLSLQGMEEGVLEYSVTGSVLTSGYNYDEVRLVATSAEGALMNFSAWYYCTEPRGILYALPSSINTTMTKGISKIIDVMLYNNGTGPTGSIFIDLPSEEWLSVVGNDTLASIAVQDSAYFSLRLSANANTTLVQYTGNIAVNCERGDGLLLPFIITAVSDSTGTLVVDVTDDYTYNGNGEHLAGATVTVKGYYSLETVATGLTGSDGTFTVEDIPEGYYRMSITAPHHAEYQATILIEGGQTNTQNIYLQYQAITYSWNVVPTEIPDEYTFELIVEYETNVPVPVVVIDMPQTFPELEEGESYVFNYIITNYGLMDTYEATLYSPTGHPLYDFTPLITELDTLFAQSTVVVPCTMTRRNRQRSQAVWEALGRGGNREETECPYFALTQTKQYYICGDREIWFWANVWRNIGGYACESVPYTPTPVAPGGGGGGYGGGGSYSPQIVIVHNDDCNLDPCLSETKDSIDNCDNNGGSVTPNLPPQNPTNNR